MVEGVAHIRHFAVVSSATGRGIGREIFEQCQVEARKAGMQHFVCYSSFNAEPFYTAVGFERCGTIYVPMGEIEFPSVRMTRVL